MIGKSTETHSISQVVRTASSWLKVCFLISREVRVSTEVRLDTSPNTPNSPKKIPSHQNSYLFQTWRVNVELQFKLFLVNLQMNQGPESGLGGADV